MGAAANCEITERLIVCDTTRAGPAFVPVCRSTQARPAAGGDPDPMAYNSEQDGFDMAWARNASAHELSAHGRTVQRRLDTPAFRPARPSLLKRLRFALYRLLHRR